MIEGASAETPRRNFFLARLLLALLVLLKVRVLVLPRLEKRLFRLALGLGLLLLEFLDCRSSRLLLGLQTQTQALGGTPLFLLGGGLACDRLVAQPFLLGRLLASPRLELPLHLCLGLGQRFWVPRKVRVGRRRRRRRQFFLAAAGRVRIDVLFLGGGHASRALGRLLFVLLFVFVQDGLGERIVIVAAREVQLGIGHVEHQHATLPAESTFRTDTVNAAANTNKTTDD